MMRRGVDLLQARLSQAVSSREAGGPEREAGEPGPSNAAVQQRVARQGRQRQQGRGVEAMEEEEEEDEEEGEGDDDDAPSIDELQSQLCSALCSLAEAVMGQAEDVDSVAAEVEGLLTRAQTTCSCSPEP